MASDPSRPRVFLDISIGTEPAGRIVIELFTDHAPKTCENFRAICTNSKPPLTYKMSPFHRIIDEFMLQGGDVTKGDGTGGMSIYGPEFEDENIGWRGIDAPGLVCMANRGKNTNSSQFFITLAACEHLNAKHTVFGHVVSGKDTIDRMANVAVDKHDKPLVDVVVSHCGELERRKKFAHSDLLQQSGQTTAASSTSRGRHKRRHSPSHSRSPSPSRGHHRRSASRQRHRHRRHRRSPAASRHSSSPTPPMADRRRSDTSADHTLRGRPRNRTRSRTRSPDIAEHSPSSPPRQHQRRRSPPPSRPRSVSGNSAGNRRQRSLPNQYNRRKHEHRGWDEQERLRREEWERDGGDRRGEAMSGRLGGYDDWGGQEENSSSGIVYKGRGAMKFKENRDRRRW